jgi:replicative DNA helicase
MAQNETQSISTVKANEAAVLGSMIIDNATISKTLMLLREESFLFLEHRLIFRAIRVLWFEQGRTAARDVKPYRIDTVVLRDKLVKQGSLDNNSVIDQNGGVQYLADVINAVPSAANCNYYAICVRESEKEREIQHKVAELTDIANGRTESDDKIQAMQEIILDIEPLSKSKAIRKHSDEADKTILSILSTESKTKTGFYGIDQIIEGFSPEDFAILGARPSMGKTSLAMNIAINIAETNKGVLVFSLETTADCLFQHLLCTQARVNYNKVRIEDPDTDEFRMRLYELAYDLKQRPLPLSICDTANTPSEIHTLIRQHREVSELKLVIIDYIQLLSLGHREPDTRQTVTEISKQLKRITRLERIPILALSQLSRNPESRTDNRPRMSDLRESGSLEQDADIVMLLHREEYYHRGDSKWIENNFDKLNTAELIIDKNRHGPCDIANLVFCPDYLLFTDRSYVMNDDIPPSDTRDDNTTLYDHPTPGPYGGGGNDAA